MMLMTCLVLADELQDVMSGKGIAPAVDEGAVVGELDRVAKRIEEVAARLERA